MRFSLASLTFVAGGGDGGIFGGVGGQNFLGKVSMELETQPVFFLWTDIQEYKAIPTVDYRYTKAKQV